MVRGVDAANEPWIAASTSVPAAWYPSPTNPRYLQYWDGSRWLPMLYPLELKDVRVRREPVAIAHQGSPELATGSQHQRALQLRGLASLEVLSGVVWVVIAALQVSLATTSPMLWPLAVAGAWNLVAACTRFLAARAIRQGLPDVPERYKRVWPVILILLVNLVLGAVLGALWALLDFFIRSQILAKADLFDPRPSAAIAVSEPAP